MATELAPAKASRLRKALTSLRARPLLAVAAALVAVSAVFAGWSGYSWFGAANDPGVTYGGTRDEVLRTGRELVAVLNTLDYHRIEQDLARWRDASTGPLRDQLSRTDDTTKKTLAQNATVSSGKVLDAALTELDTHAGTAKMLVAVEISVTKEGTAPAAKRNRFAAALARTEAGWKLSALDQLPVGAR
ncbi:hypothetical protein [Amycolatopsis samaneae]|uniref:Mce-associated membrane protein n=1 Tax=Amycolatopsis samaneae TaxID=664691 RepID=A0ABW5G819_9PSEU